LLSVEVREKFRPGPKVTTRRIKIDQLNLSARGRADLPWLVREWRTTTVIDSINNLLAEDHRRLDDPLESFQECRPKDVSGAKELLAQFISGLHAVSAERGCALPWRSQGFERRKSTVVPPRVQRRRKEASCESIA
jgi:hypothetical protein